MATGACVGIAALAAVLIRTAIDVRPAEPDGHDAIVRRPLPGAKAPPRAKVLCGVDCLYLAVRLARAPDPDYGRLLRLIRPGTHGTTLETLRVVSECLDLRAELVNPRRFDRPPEILIAHVAPRHFVVVTPLEAGAVAILDPGRGAFRGEWEAVRGRLSPVALALQGRVAS
jgi:ABC-type bacteriocin/lantibiotic exporter with double-glycine peptidase domain